MSTRVRARSREPFRARCRGGAGRREREDGQAFSWEGAGPLSHSCYHFTGRDLGKRAHHTRGPFYAVTLSIGKCGPLQRNFCEQQGGIRCGHQVWGVKRAGRNPGFLPLEDHLLRTGQLWFNVLKFKSSQFLGFNNRPLVSFPFPSRGPQSPLKKGLPRPFSHDRYS